MPLRTIQLPELVGLFRQMQPCQWQGQQLCGELRVSTPEMASFLRELLTEARSDDYPCTVVSGDPDNPQINDVFSLRFGQVRTAVGIIVATTHDLLKNRDIATGSKPLSWYVHDIDEASGESKNLSQRLANVHRLLKALEGTASVYDARNMQLVFLRNGRFDVPIQYDADALNNMDQAAASDLILQLELQDSHTAQRHEICATAICEMLASTPIEKRFSKVLSGLAELQQRVIDGYRLFSASFSFEKVRDQAEAIRVEYTGKIHKTLSDIQGQLLGIPVSVIIVATQFKDVKTNGDGQLWINSGVILGAFIFCVLFALSALNQWHTLSVLEDELERHKKY